MTLDEFIQDLRTYICNRMPVWASYVDPELQIDHFENTQIIGEGQESQILIPGRFKTKPGPLVFQDLKHIFTNQIVTYQRQHPSEYSFFVPTILFTPPCRFLIILS